MSDTEDNTRDRGRRDRMSRGGDSFRDRSIDRGRELRSMKSSNNRVYVSNIPYEYRWQDVKDLFRNEVGDVQFVELFFDDADKPKGSGIVEFADAASVKKCMEVMQRYEVKGRKLVVKEDAGNARDRHGAIQGGRRSDRFRDDYRRESISLRSAGGDTNTYGLSLPFLQSLNIEPPLGNKVFVANLAYNVDERKIKEAFKLAGKVLSVEIPLDKEGRSRGFAVVEYDHPVECVQAISMFHDQVFFDRNITVRMDRERDSFRLPEGLRSIGMGLGPNGEPLKCVAHNLPSLASSSQQGNALGGGMLGGLTNNLQLANALSGLNSLGGLNQQVLQAAGLLGQNLGNADLSSLVQTSLTSGSNSAPQPFSQNSSTNFSSANSNYNRGTGGGGDYGSNQVYNTSNTADMGYQNTGNDYGNNDRMSFGDTRQEQKGFSKKVMVSNLPPTVSYNLLSEKFSEFGDVVAFEPKSQTSVLLTYGSDWQAERAIKNLDKARIDGRMIDARLYF